MSNSYCLNISLDKEVWDLVDMLELCAYHCGEASIENIGRIFDTRREHEDLDYEDHETTQDEYTTALYDEVAYRVDKIGDAYPYTYSDCETKLVYKDEEDQTDGSYVYLFCLLLSTYKIAGIEVLNDERNLFESCTVIGSAGLFQGNSCHFGFPRPNNNGFLERLKEIFEDDIGDGKVREHFEIGVNPNMKDGKIDVITWPLNWRDGHPIYFVQAAAGFNWEDKPPKPFADISKLTHWFSTMPTSKIIDVLAIPHDLHPKRWAPTRADTEKYYSTLYGPMIWRFTLPPNVNKGMALLTEASIIEHIDKLDEIKEWVETQRSLIGKCA